MPAAPAIDADLRPPTDGAPAPCAGVYGISVAAELAGCGVQALRSYEQRGLLTPARTPAGTRRYSLDDVNQVRHITNLLGLGLNIAGIAAVLTLEAENAALRAENARLRQQLGNGPYHQPAPTA